MSEQQNENSAAGGQSELSGLVMPTSMDKTYIQYSYDTRISDEPAIHGMLGAYVDYDDVDKDFKENWQALISKEGDYLFEIYRIPDECYEGGDGVGYWGFTLVLFEEFEA